jgi:Lrp/AsnC family transcriptional regulator for asnA, asnC and gidA
MDEMDLSITLKLTKDARMSFRKIAKEIGVSPNTVMTRYKTLREKGVIRGSTVVINPKRIGYNNLVVFLIDASPSHILAGEATIESATILDKLIQMQNIIVATKTVGDHDLLAIGVAIDSAHLIKLGDDIANIPGVKDLEIIFWVESTELCPKYFLI